MSDSHVELHYLYLSKQISDSHVARKFSQWDDEDRCQGLVWEGSLEGYVDLVKDSMLDHTDVRIGEKIQSSE